MCEHPLPLVASTRGRGAWWSGLRRGGSPEKERGREREREYGYGKPLSPEGEMGPVVLWVGVCVCVDSVCEHPLPLLASPRGGGGGAWWSGLRRGGSPEKERERERERAYGYGKPLSPARLGGDGASGFVGMCVCGHVCVSTHFHFLPPQGGGVVEWVEEGGVS